MLPHATYDLSFERIGGNLVHRIKRFDPVRCLGSACVNLVLLSKSCPLVLVPKDSSGSGHFELL